MEALRFALPGMSLAALACGEGEPVLALHGWMDNAASFAPLAPFWRRGRLIALDLPGHGHSDHRQGAYYFVDYLYEIYQVVEQLGGQVHLLGHSMGAMLATSFAGLFPEKVKSLQLIDGLLPLSDAPHKAAQTLKAAILSRLKQTGRPSRVYPSIEAMAQARSEAGDFSPEQALPLVLRASIEKEDGFHWRTDPKLRTTSPIRLTAEQVESLLAGLCCPVRAYLGRTGLYSGDPGRLDRELALLGLREPVWLDGGHHLQLEAPADLVRLVEEMLTLT
ncbi:alpha/beta hydrolase [Gallaecimonas kandeliae]|uniref:alpha/beta fold hydrolase n=1 Tax=Gallaecimonas kandeliae TaxID=3029055 RepID=UPI002647CA54|nr:alpha/beta hydrolase [Gallaecimonas kandeliae]WKE64408.1 alpha/beta hydrolase [Gallaecimonas kandeliae]